VTDEPAAKGKSTAFRLVPRSDTQGPALAAYVTAHYAGRPLAIVQDGSPYGRMVADSARAALAAAGIVPAAEATVPGSIPDFAGTVAELKSRAIGVVIYGGYARAAGALAAEARKQGLDLALGGGDALGAPELWSAAGAAGDGVFMTALPDPRELGAARVVESGLAHFGVNTSGYTIRAYAAMQVIAQAAEQAKSLDPAEVAKAMHAGSFETAMGTVAFDAKGDLAEQRWSIRVWRDGRIVAP
jgi:branched-chain amino acid transport system substrate-binding protein